MTEKKRRYIRTNRRTHAFVEFYCISLSISLSLFFFSFLSFFLSPNFFISPYSPLYTSFFLPHILYSHFLSLSLSLSLSRSLSLSHSSISFSGRNIAQNLATDNFWTQITGRTSLISMRIWLRLSYKKKRI